MASTLLVDTVTKIATAWGQDADTAVYSYLTSVAGTNTITAIGPVGLAAYAAGLAFRFIPAVTNTAAVTINITGTGALGARAITKYGTNALVAGDLRTDTVALIIDDGTRFQLLNPAATAIATTSLVTPFVGAAFGANLGLSADASAAVWQVDRNSTPAGLALSPVADNTRQLGDATHRISQLFIAPAGINILVTKRKTADESVTSSATLQDDDHLTFAIAASEEWNVTYFINAGAAANLTGIKLAVTVPAGATLDTQGYFLSTSEVGFGRSAVSGTASLNIATASTATNIYVGATAWVLNGATPGSVTLQWAQGTSNGTALTFRKGSYLTAIRVA